MPGESTSSKTPEVRGEGQLLQALMGHWIHEDNLYWTQIRHLLVLQLTVLAAWFGLGTHFSVLAMFLSALISLRIYFLADTIRKNRNVNFDVIKVVSKNVVSSETETELRKILGEEEYDKFGPLRYAAHSLDKTKDAGKQFQCHVFGFSIFLNLVMGVLTIQGLTCEDAWLDRLHPKFAGQEPYDVQPNPARQEACMRRITPPLPSK